MSKINKVYQKLKIYKPMFTDRPVGCISVMEDKSSCNSNIELMGTYKNIHRQRGYCLEEIRIVLITSQVINEEEKTFDFGSIYDVPKGNKIEIDGQEYIITDKKYHLNGNIDYYIEDKFIKCENYDELYDTVFKQAKDFLNSKREQEEEIMNHEAEKGTGKKKSIWSYFGIR